MSTAVTQGRDDDGLAQGGDWTGREMYGSWVHFQSRTHRISRWMGYGMRETDKRQR